MIFLPLVYPELFERFHIAPPRGVLFYGPPGGWVGGKGNVGAWAMEAAAWLVASTVPWFTYC